MGKAGIGRRIVEARDRLRPRLVGNVHDEHAGIEIGEVEPVRPLRIDVGVVRAVALVELRGLMARRRRLIVAFARARQPPASDLGGLRRVAHVEAAIELVVEWMSRLEVRGAGGHVDVFAVAEPKLMYAAGKFAAAIDEGDRLRFLRHGNIEKLEARRLLADLLALIGHCHHVAADLERIRAHIGLRQIGLHDHFGLARIRHVDGGEILRRALMRQPDDTAAVRRDLDRHAFAHAAEAVELVLGEQLEIPADGFVAALQRALVRHAGSLALIIQK